MKKMFILAMTCLFAFCGTSAFAKEMPITGGWQATESPVITKEVQSVFDKAMKGFVGAHYKPVAYLGSQIVAGKNYCILCQAKVVVPNAKPYYAMMYIYEDLKGNAKITNIEKLNIAELSNKKDGKNK